MGASPTTAALPHRSRLTRIRRVLGTAILVAGLLTLAWAFVVWRWNDPLTALYTRWEQHRLVGAHNRIVAEFRLVKPIAPNASQEDEAAAVASAALRLRAGASAGAPIGRIVVPRLHLNMLMVNGTDTETLKLGPGRDERTYMPGQGQLVYIAGHRTTYLAPFSAIDTMRPGDTVTLKMPYATFTYAVTGHSIVRSDDLSVLKSHGHEVVALQACHPRFFATQRYIVWARAVRVVPMGGRPYALRPS
jgi:sortase A